MKYVSVLLLTFAIASAFATDDQEWKDYKETYNKQYSSREDLRRQKIFTENKIKIADHNKKFENGEESFKMGINQFSDMLPEEMKQFKGLNGNSNVKPGQKVTNFRRDVDYPDSVDWRDSGCVSPVKDQGQCGSAWAYAVTGSIESVCCIKYGDPVALSTQNLIDCAYSGCSGGLVSDGYDYCTSNGGLDTEESYPFTGKAETCQFDPASAQCSCTGYDTIPSGDEDELAAAVAIIGPVASAIDASQLSFQLYVGGVYYDANCNSELLDHGVLIVGYGTDNGVDYWIVKNSWGTSWGESGYIRMARNRNNNCGIATDASFPIV